MIQTYFVVQEDQLIVNAMDLFSAGSETTATTLAWAVAFMIIEPQVHVQYSRWRVQTMPKSGLYVLKRMQDK
jgi:cytochrome P450